MFGHQIEGDHLRYWGARTIYKNQEIDMLRDRQSSDGIGHEPEDQAFIKWLNERALPWLREKVKEISLAVDDPQELVLHEFKYELRASTHQSHGYLYIGAVEHKLVECEPRKNSASGAEERVVEAGGVKFVVDDGSLVPVGSEGIITANKIGPAKVVGYYNENYGDFKLACLMVVMLDPPDWWVSQTQDNELKKLNLSKKQEKEWRKKWKPSPCALWANDFKAA